MNQLFGITCLMLISTNDYYYYRMTDFYVFHVPAHQKTVCSTPSTLGVEMPLV